MKKHSNGELSIERHYLKFFDQHSHAKFSGAYATQEFNEALLKFVKLKYDYMLAQPGDDEEFDEEPFCSKKFKVCLKEQYELVVKSINKLIIYDLDTFVPAKWEMVQENT